ncbi:MAG: hypothetical protein IPH88_14790 [Bacteroidales bacterium]|nr:hypothetical protein [Bacteroidales bacterium]
MLKKAGNIVIVFLLLIATAGIPFTRHYCGSTVMSFSVFSTPEPCRDNHCDKCHNIFKFSKLESEFESGIINIINAPQSFLTLQPFFFVDFLTLIPPPSSYTLFNHRAVFDFKTCFSPASLGVFRC